MLLQVEQTLDKGIGKGIAKRIAHRHIDTRNMNLKKITSCAQELYEGVEVKGEGKIALITYIRTDSTRVSPDAQKACRDFISQKYGNDYYYSCD